MVRARGPRAGAVERVAGQGMGGIQGCAGPMTHTTHASHVHRSKSGDVPTNMVFCWIGK